MVDLKRRHFIFGAAATLILPPKKTFHFLDGQHRSIILRPDGFILKPGKLFDLPNAEAFELGRKLVEGSYRMKDIPRWVVLDQQWYNDMLRVA